MRNSAAQLIGVSLLLLLSGCGSRLGSAQQSDQPLEVEQVGSSNDQSEATRLTLDQLKKAGSNLSKPHNFEFYLYFPSKDDAGKAAADLAKEGFKAKIDSVEKSTTWVCKASKKSLPSQDQIERLEDCCRSLAMAHHGNYDGFESDVQK